MLTGAHRIPLVTYLDEYAAVRQLTPAVQRQYRAAVEQLERGAGRPLHLADLDEGLLSTWLTTVNGSPKTKRNRLAAILAIWRGAAAAFPDLALPTPARLVRFRWTKPLPDAWTPAELGRLLQACQHYRPRMRMAPWTGFTYGSYFYLLVRLAYDTGLRRGDLHAITLDQIGPDGAEIVQSKTGRRIRVAISPEARHLLELAPRPQLGPLLPRLPSHTHALHWKRILQKASLPTGRRHGLQKIRRTSATQIEIAHPGAGPQHLGHATPGLAAKHYLDASQLGQSPRLPPPPPVETLETPPAAPN